NKVFMFFTSHTKTPPLATAATSTHKISELELSAFLQVTEGFGPLQLTGRLFIPSRQHVYRYWRTSTIQTGVQERQKGLAQTCRHYRSSRRSPESARGDYRGVSN